MTPPEPTRQSPGAAALCGIRVAIQCGPHQWGFTCTDDSRQELLQRIVELARDPDCVLDEMTARVALTEIARMTPTVLPQTRSESADLGGGAHEKESTEFHDD